MNAVSIISVCFGGISLLVSFILFIRTLTRDSKETMEEQATRNDNINASLLKQSLMLESITQNVCEIKTEIKAINTNINDVERRVSLIENEQKAMWIRVDELKEKVNG